VDEVFQHFHETARGGGNATTVNAAIDGFVHVASIELPRGLRINSVNPTVVSRVDGCLWRLLPGL